ncbi:MAG: CHAD domain-containing protein, partial [Pseudomonadales bacterium]
TCKQLASANGDFFERREVEQTTLHETPSLDTLEDGPVLELLRRYVPASAELVPCFRQDNERQLYVLTHRDYPRASIEMVMDQVRVSGASPLAYIEFEGELKQGPQSFLEEFAGVLRAEPGLIRARTSKFHRGHFNTSPLTGIGERRRELMTPDDTWTRLAADYLQEQLEALAYYEPFAYEGLHTEGVHQMRVATRRMRAALKAFGDVLPEESARRLAAEAGWLCDVLGEVRDLDVQLERLAQYRSQLPSTRQSTLDAYERHLKTSHQQARRCLVAALDGRRYTHFLNRYRGLQGEANELIGGGPTIRDFARRELPTRLERIRRAGRKIRPGSPPEAYHRLRIRIKKLRYGLEILEGPYGETLAGVTKALRRLQGRLGDHQDACVAQTELAQYRDTLASAARERRTFDRLIAIEAERAAELRSRFPKDWRKFDKASHELARIL